MQFYPGDWRKDPGVQALDYESRGIWFEILLLMFESQERGRLLLNGQPMPIEALCRFLGLDNQKTTKTLTKLTEYGVVSKDENGVFYSRRMIRDEEIRAIRKNSGSMGGNPNLVNQNSTTGDNQNPTPSKEDEYEDEREEIKTAKQVFDEARKSYPGTRNGLEREWNNFRAKQKKNIPNTVQMILPAIEREKAYKAFLKSKGDFCPPWANFQTWINQERWTQEFTVPQKQESRRVPSF